MSLLVVQIPPRARLRARDQRDPAGASDAAAHEFLHVWSPDGRQVGRTARAAAALLPKADNVVAVLGDADIGWHRLMLPKAPPARLRAALVGMLEEALLDEPTNTHLALAPEAKSGETGWVAAVHRPWLTAQLAALEAAQVFVDRVVPSSWPDEPPRAHFQRLADLDDAPLALTWSHPDGVATLDLQGGLGRTVLPQPWPAGAIATATPSAAAAAEVWLGAPVALQTEAERLLAAAASPWNLRQFDLARRHRGLRALKDAWHLALGPAWRPVRLGLVALVAVQLVGLNAWAWTLRQQLSDRRAEMVKVLQTTFPQVRAVLDAPLQMEREVQNLRSLAGKPGDADLEPLLLAAAAAWPAGRPPVDMLRYEPGSLSLGAAGWGPAEVDEFRGRMQATGLTVDLADGRLTIRRAGRTPPPGAAS